MTVLQVQPVMDASVRGLCAAPYDLHPGGCPNLGKCDRCPPKAPLFNLTYDFSKPIYAVINEFNLAGHVERMRVKNPNWSDRQLYCVLYWQNTARKQLEYKISEALKVLPGYTAERCPEAMGVNVTATVGCSGVILEWPPRSIVRHVALLGVKL